MKLVIIDGSIRNAKATPRVAKWVEKSARQNLQDVEIETVDLKELNLPQFEEPVSPMMNPDRKPEGAVKQWLDTLASADGFVFITPEYNHSMPGGLKNAIDLIDHQVTRKPFATVGHGGTGAARAIGQVKQALNANIGAVPMPVSVHVLGYIGYTNDFDEDGNATSETVKKLEGTLADVLNNLQWYMKALKTAREE
mgnify:CR=1 FL=1